MKALVITTLISGAVLASAAWALSWITLVEAAGTLAVGLLITLAVARLREKAVKVPSDDEGQRHHRGRGGGGLM